MRKFVPFILSVFLFSGQAILQAEDSKIQKTFNSPQEVFSVMVFSQKAHNWEQRYYVMGPEDRQKTLVGLIQKAQLFTELGNLLSKDEKMTDQLDAIWKKYQINKISKKIDMDSNPSEFFAQLGNKGQLFADITQVFILESDLPELIEQELTDLEVTEDFATGRIKYIENNEHKVMDVQFEKVNDSWYEKKI